jgi:cellulose synthase/poly-beta-1,6-N-acetylglucosamine synthase-like glycosyltransferase
MGTGMCFKTSLLKKMKWNAYSLSEDWEYYAKLIEKGYRIGFSVKSIIHQQESNSLSQATSQRLRWSSGRFYVLKTLGFKLLLKGIRNRDLVTTDASLALLLPNWSLQVNLLILSLFFSLFLIGTDTGVLLLGSILVLLILQVVIVIAGSFLTGQPIKTLKSVIYAPVFLIWKLCIDLLCITKLYKGKEWIRTSRHIPK